MKIPFRILVVIFCAFSLQLISCSKKHDPKATTDIQLDKLRANWKATQVTSDGVVQDWLCKILFWPSPVAMAASHSTTLQAAGLL